MLDETGGYTRTPTHIHMNLESMAISGSDLLEVPTIY